MKDHYKQKSVDLMGEHLLDMLNYHVEQEDFEYSLAIYSEWVVDNQDPQDGSYEFIFINDLTKV